MAIQSAIFVPAQAAGNREKVTTSTVADAASSTEIALGPNVLFSLISDGPVYVRFGSAGLGAADSTDMYTAGSIITFDTGNAFNSIRIFNNSGTTVTYSVVQLMRF